MAHAFLGLLFVGLAYAAIRAEQAGRTRLTIALGIATFIVPLILAAILGVEPPSR